MQSVRLPAVAGAFYEDDPQELRASLSASFLSAFGPGRLPQVDPNGPRQIIGLVCPHAGFRYSGPAAAWAYEALAADGIPEVVVILGTNHRLAGAPAAVSPDEAWETPLGRLAIDPGLRTALQSCEVLAADMHAHEFEHSIEVQLPWLQFIYEAQTKIFPIALGQISLRAIHNLAGALTTALASRNAVIIASSDFSHYISAAKAQHLDSQALEQIVTLSTDGLLATVSERHITMCGVIPVAVMLETARGLRAQTGKLLCYYTSGDITGDKSAVVGYAAVSISK
jgi:MEMO1 family protein